MASKTTLKIRLENRKKALEAAWEAYHDILNGRAQSYTIGTRTITKHNLADLVEIIERFEKETDELEAALLNGGKRRKAVGVVFRDL